MVKVIVDSQPEREGERRPARRGGEWAVMAATGFVFTVLSLVDLVITLVPIHFESIEWQFGTATQVMNNLPLLVVGLVFIAVAGFGAGSRLLLQVSGVVLVVIWVFVLAMALMFFPHLSVAKATVTDPGIGEGLSRAITKTTVQLVAYLVGIGVLGWKVLQGARR